MDDTSDLEMNALRRPEDLADFFRMPRGYVRAAIDAGCPTQEGILSHTSLFLWIYENCAAFRASLGLETLPTGVGLSEGLQASIRLTNAWRTMGDYMAKRGVTDKTKDLGAFVIRTIEEIRATRDAMP